jgi:PAS domain S-box-containing protein
LARKNSELARNSFAMTEATATIELEKTRTLADAIVDTVREPLVVLDRDLRVLMASRSFYRAFGTVPEETLGRLFYALAGGQWDIPALRALLEEVILDRRTIEAYEIDHEFGSIGCRTLLLNAREVFDEANPNSALLLAIEDVTQRRAAEREKDELLREKEVLLEEMRHRVANSLQIIASILLLKARTVQSEETASTCRTPTSGSCRLRPCRSNCAGRDWAIESRSVHI